MPRGTTYISNGVHMMKKNFIAIFIILLLPLAVSGHGLEPTLTVDAGTLPDSPKYGFKRVWEWLDVNLLTVSTKKKEQKHLVFSSEKVAEIGRLSNLKKHKTSDLQLALSEYKTQIDTAEMMTEKVIWIDGAEIGEADNLELETRLQEKFLREQKEQMRQAGVFTGDIVPIMNEALDTARIYNEKIFTYMVEHYQLTDADIRKHRIILSKNISLTREAMLYTEDQDKIKKATDILNEAEKFRMAGLNLEAYRLIKTAKDQVY